jgi:membrane fusion protein, macrolide-specific efflux system
MSFNFIMMLLLSILISCKKNIAYPERGEIIEAVYGLGTVESEDTFHARSAIITSVQEFFVKEGEDVKRGQPLFRTDQGAITRAPFSGRVTQIFVSVGENLFPQTQILTLMNLDSLFLSVSLEQQGAMRVKKGLNAEVSFEFFRNKKLHGTISTLYPRQDQFIAKVMIDQWPQGVLPGMTADVAFEIDRKSQALLIPTLAIANGHITISRQGKKMKIPVEVGLVDLDRAEILSPELFETDEILLP